MDIQQNNVAVLHFNLVNQDGSTIFIRKTKLATFNLINPSAVSVPITDIGFDATLNQCWIRIYSVFEQETFYLLKQGKIGFGGQVIQDAYNSYDVAISKERSQIENALKKIQTKFISLQSTEMKIQPLKFIVDENTNPTK